MQKQKNCKQCYKVFVKDKINSYCSKECRDKYNKQRKKRLLKMRKNKDKIMPDTSNYKEPLKKLGKSEGFGFYGVLTSSENGEFVQCHVCGKWLRTLANSHLKKHELTQSEYKKEFKLASSTKLVSRKYSAALARRFNETARKNPRFLKNLKKTTKENIRKLIQSNKDRKGSKQSLETKNKRGTCRMQLIEKIKEVAEHYDTKTPKRKMFYDYYKSKYINAVYSEFGSWTDAVKAAGMTVSNPSHEPKWSKEKIIESFKKYYKTYKKTVEHHELKKYPELPSNNSVVKYIGGLNQARWLAKIPIIVPLGGNKGYGYIDYMDYKDDKKLKDRLFK